MSRHEDRGQRALREEHWTGHNLTPIAPDETPLPGATDRDRDRILRLQSALQDIVHNVTLGKLKVGLRVIEARTGRVFFGRSATALMDPASNQKVLATTTALVRLGADWRFRTEVYGPVPDSDGVVRGNLFLRGSGDPTLGPAELEELANKLLARGITRVAGAIIADPRRIGDDSPVPEDEERPPLLMNRGLLAVRVRPMAVGEPPLVILDPPPPPDSSGAPIDVAVTNLARTREGRRGKLVVQVNVLAGVLQIGVAGRIAPGPGMVFRRRLPQAALATAVFFRAALIRSGVTVRDRASIGTPSANAILLAAHRSPPLAVLLRKINKDSDNYEAERLLATVGAEVQGGAATTEKGAAVLRQVIGEFGLDPRSYLPKNASGLGHGNRITALAMTDLLRALYLDPRVGPEMLQSLSVGGVDGTTRNRFRGTPVERRVRAKTGTLNGKSCLSGLVGDGEDVVAFSIMVEGFRSRGALGAVRGAQVAAVNTMMRYVQERGGARIDLTPAFDLPTTGTDYETGGEGETDQDAPEAPPTSTGPPTPNAEGAVLATALPSSARGQPDLNASAAVSPAAGVAPGVVVDGEPSGSFWAPLFAKSARLGFAGVGSLAGSDPAPGLALFVDWGAVGSGLGIDLSLYGTTFHSFTGPGIGITDWTRFAGALGPRYQLSRGPWVVDLHAQLGAGWFLVRGRGYTTNSSSQTMAVALGSGARLSWERSGLSPWMGVDIVGWLGSHDVHVVGNMETRAVPAIDLLLSIGGSVHLW